MTSNQKAAYAHSQTVCAWIKAMGMFSENMQRSHLGLSMAYVEEDFNSVSLEFGIHHNDIHQYVFIE